MMRRSWGGLRGTSRRTLVCASWGVAGDGVRAQPSRVQEADESDRFLCSLIDNILAGSSTAAAGCFKDRDFGGEPPTF